MQQWQPRSLLDLQYVKHADNKFFAAINAISNRDYLERSEYLTKDDIESAWSLLVQNGGNMLSAIDGESTIARSALTDRLSVVMPDVDAGVVTHLLGGSGNMSYERLVRLLWHDGAPALPCNMAGEAWTLLDPHGRGIVGLDTLLRMLTALTPGFEKLDAADMSLIRSLLEMSPNSNVLREENWTQLGSWIPKHQSITPAQRKMLAARAAAAGGGKGRGTGRSYVPRR